MRRATRGNETGPATRNPTFFRSESVYTIIIHLLNHSPTHLSAAWIRARIRRSWYLFPRLEGQLDSEVVVYFPRVEAENSEVVEPSPGEGRGAVDGTGSLACTAPPGDVVPAGIPQLHLGLIVVGSVSALLAASHV